MSTSVRVCPTCCQKFTGSIIKYNKHIQKHLHSITCTRCGFSSDIASTFSNHTCISPSKQKSINEFTFQQHVRDHSMNDDVWINCRYCNELRVTSRSIVRNNNDRELEQKKEVLMHAFDPKKEIKKCTLSVNLPPFIPTKRIATEEPISAFQWKEKIVACKTSPPKSMKLENSRMEH